MEQIVTDRDLVENSLNGSRQDFEILVKRYSKKLYLFIFNRTGNREDTEDIIQETFLKVYKNLSGYDPKWNFSTWIYTIAMRISVSHFRYTNVRERKPIFPLSPTTESPEEKMIKNDVSSIWEAADKLGTVKYEVIRLRYGDGLTIKEIVKITGKTSVNIRVILYRAKNELIRIMNRTVEPGMPLQKYPEKSMTLGVKK
ncbi:MAG: sigma-70 family RNA polymerase sigma factor [Candidatus Aminicenantes bacterium]|nr:sigma-70 family RNA polymerase sigma factor [Candidatus Aminicenantes bacterium]